MPDYTAVSRPEVKVGRVLFFHLGLSRAPLVVQVRLVFAPVLHLISACLAYLNCECLKLFMENLQLCQSVKKGAIVI